MTNMIIFCSLVTDAEYRRLYDAFKRVVTQNSHMSKQAFTREVLGDLFPAEIAGVIKPKLKFKLFFWCCIV